jgi:hypothetical protein
MKKEVTFERAAFDVASQALAIVKELAEFFIEDVPSTHVERIIITLDYGDSK